MIKTPKTSTGKAKPHRNVGRPPLPKQFDAAQLAQLKKTASKVAKEREKVKKDSE